MAKFTGRSVEFEEIDGNHDGVIDKNEFHEWVSKDEGLPSSSFSSFTLPEHTASDNSGGPYHLVPYQSYTPAMSGNFSDDAMIHTKSENETNTYLTRTTDIYHDPNPQIVRRAAIDGPRRYEQRIMVRYLQPPDLPPHGPLIIQEMRPPQPSAPSSLVVTERPPSPPPPPPLILRERPPTPPPKMPSEIKEVWLPPAPVPSRSVVIKRFPPAPEKPRDIIIERWLPYAPRPPRQTIVKPAPAALKYSEPRNKIEIYETVQIQVVRNFKKLGPFRENPDDYRAHHKGILLDSATLDQQARHAGVHENTTPPGR